MCPQRNKVNFYYDSVLFYTAYRRIFTTRYSTLHLPLSEQNGHTPNMHSCPGHHYSTRGTALSFMLVAVQEILVCETCVAL